jgi:hypothetical protein
MIQFSFAKNIGTPKKRERRRTVQSLSKITTGKDASTINTA